MSAAPTWKRAATLLWIAGVVGFVAYEAREVDWDAVVRVVRGYGWGALAIAGLLVAPGYLACASYDLVGRHCTGHRIPWARTTAISFVGYCFSLNLGALVGGLAFRYRLYASSGLSPWRIGQVIALSVVTNWSGYVVLAGLLLALAPPDLPSSWRVPASMLRACGFAFLATAALYLGACLLKGGRRIRWRGRELVLPGIGIAGVQLALSLVSWGAIGAAIAWLMPGDISWLDVMPVVLTSAVAGVLSHVPGGLGVIEAVFAAMLGHEVERSQLLGALLAFRTVYYLVPLAVAVAVFTGLEATARGRVGVSRPLERNAVAPDR